MDSIQSSDKSRSRSRKNSHDFKFDNFKSNFDIQEEKLLVSVKNSPDSETNSKHWAIVSEGFPPGVTVDELKKFSRRRQLTHLRPQDNLRLEEGSLRLYKSEYKRRYLAYSLPKVILSSEDQKVIDDDEENSCIYSLRGPLLRPKNNLFILKEHPMESITEKNSKYVPFENYEKRKLLRRSTALKPEGDIAKETEVRKEYIDHKNVQKAHLIRNLPSLRLEGNFEPLTTEQRDKFIAYILSQRPVLEKKKTSLKMEGNFDFATEKNRSYVPHEYSARPRIRKRSTSLKLEGEVEFSPEYRISYVDFPRTRPVTYKPLGKLRHEGEFENLTEMKTQFVNYENVRIPESAKPENNLHVEGEMEINPEYRINFVNFPRERPILRRPFNQLQPEGNLQVLTESSEKRLGGEEVPSENPQKPSDVTLDKEWSYLSENTSKVKEDEIPEKQETPKENPKQETNTKVERNEELISARGKSPRREKLENDYIFYPDFRKSHAETENVITHEKDRKGMKKKGQREKFKTSFEEDKKTPRRKSSVKRLKESGSDKIQIEIQQEKSRTFEEGKKRDSHQLRFSDVSPKDSFHSAKEFPAFKVLDVKGQMGCQSLGKDILESEKSTSDEENSTYRLEVYNSEQRSPGFYGNGKRVFSDLAVDKIKLEEAEAKARQRAENYVKIVKSPEIPNCLLENREGNDIENRWRLSNKLCPLSPVENTTKRSFVVLEQNDTPEIGNDKDNWLINSCDSLPI